MTNQFTNMHFHTHFSFNAENYSPSEIALRSKQAGLALAGIVDFDVLDGLDEFFASASDLDLKVCGGIETRVYVPEFADLVINSPGEPGIAYHMGTGIPSGHLQLEQKQFIDKLRTIAANRNIEIVKRVNEYLNPVTLNYDKDVLPLTPKANVTERHICIAYANKAKSIFSDKNRLAEFWKSKIGIEDITNIIALLNTIRAKTMKSGGVGYVKPDAKSFPTMTEMNEFVLSVGGIPTLAWLDGTSEGEKKIKELLTLAISTGVEAVNIIPDRNYTPGLGSQDKKKNNLYEFINICNDLDLPVIAGTEMNSPGQKFVDDFNSDELKPLTDTFLHGALIVYGHTILQRQCGLGYKSKWASANFKNRAEKNGFYAEIGKNIEPKTETIIHGFSVNSSADEILKKVKR